MRRQLAVATVILLAVLPLTSGGLHLASAAPPGSPWGASYFPNVPLVTQNGQTVHFYDDLLKDKIVVVNFIYTHCQDACPLETARLAQVRQRLGERMGNDIFFHFQSRCVACHSLGQGDRVGPDLRGVTTRRDRAWLARFIATPDRVLAENDPIAIDLFAKYQNVQMPNLHLGEADVAALLTYLERLDAAHLGATPKGSVAAR